MTGRMIGISNKYSSRRLCSEQGLDALKTVPAGVERY